MPVSPSIVRRITLRLDNGSLVASHPKWGAIKEKQARLIPYEEGFEKGLVTEADVERMSSMLAQLDNASALNCKRKFEQVQPVRSCLNICSRLLFLAYKLWLRRMGRKRWVESRERGVRYLQSSPLQARTDKLHSDTAHI